MIIMQIGITNHHFVQLGKKRIFAKYYKLQKDLIFLQIPSAIQHQ